MLIDVEIFGENGVSPGANWQGQDHGSKHHPRGCLLANSQLKHGPLRGFIIQEVRCVHELSGSLSAQVSVERCIPRHHDHSGLLREASFSPLCVDLCGEVHSKAP